MIQRVSSNMKISESLKELATENYVQAISLQGARGGAVG